MGCFCIKPKDLPTGFLICLKSVWFFISGTCEPYQCHSTHTSHRSRPKHPASFWSTGHPLFHPSWLVSATLAITRDRSLCYDQRKIDWECGNLINFVVSGMFEIVVLPIYVYLRCRSYSKWLHYFLFVQIRFRSFWFGQWSNTAGKRRETCLCS